MCSVSDLPMDQIILTRAAITDFPGAKYLHVTMVWTQIKINRAFFVLVFVVDFFGGFFFGSWGGSSIARGGGPPGWHLWTCWKSLYRKMSGSLLKLKNLFIFRVTLNIFYCSILIGYYTVLCTIWKDIVRVCIVLKTRIGRDAAQASSPIRVFNTIRTTNDLIITLAWTISVYDADLLEDTYKNIYKFWVDRTMNK